jgi:hypothetical protein
MPSKTKLPGVSAAWTLDVKITTGFFLKVLLSLLMVIT